MKVVISSNDNNQLLLGTKFRVFKDKSIEIPFTFSDEQFDEFLEAIVENGIFTLMKEN